MYDVCSQRLRVSGHLHIVTFNQAFGSESESEEMIQSLANRLCDDEPFLGEESGQRYIVISVERNSDPGAHRHRDSALPACSLVLFMAQDPGRHVF